jgi:hypothetical protein
MNTKSRIAPPVPQAESPLRHLPLVDLLVDTKTELLELALRSGLKVFTAMLEEDRNEKNEDQTTGSLVTEAEDSLHCRTPKRRFAPITMRGPTDHHDVDGLITMRRTS